MYSRCTWICIKNISLRSWHRSFTHAVTELRLLTRHSDYRSGELPRPGDFHVIHGQPPIVFPAISELM